MAAAAHSEGTTAPDASGANTATGSSATGASTEATSSATELATGSSVSGTVTEGAEVIAGENSKITAKAAKATKPATTTRATKTAKATKVAKATKATRTVKKTTKSATKSTAKSAAKTTRASARRNRPGPRQRLLASATHLFTTQGIRVIGIDRILRDADVAKASLYSLFGSKDNLVVAYLEELDQKWRADWHEIADIRTKPEERIIAFFDLCIRDEPKNNYRGSHFQNAASEYPLPETDSEQAIRDAAMEYRRWCRDTMAGLLTERFGYASNSLADQLMVFMDGGLAGAKMSRNTIPLETARDLAKQLLLTVPMSYSI